MAKNNKMMILAVFLLCATLMSTHFSSGLYAKYTVSNHASDEARVAQFHIETDLDYISLGLPNNETPEFEIGGVNATNEVELPFYIESRSEVAVSYSVKVAFGEALPSYVTLTLSDGTKSQTLNADGAKSTYEFQKFGTMEVSDQETLRTDLTLKIGVTALEMITQEIEVPTAVLTVQVDQID